jgi:hypothetical protein
MQKWSGRWQSVGIISPHTHGGPYSTHGGPPTHTRESTYSTHGGPYSTHGGPPTHTRESTYSTHGGPPTHTRESTYSTHGGPPQQKGNAFTAARMSFDITAAVDNEVRGHGLKSTGKNFI